MTQAENACAAAQLGSAPASDEDDIRAAQALPGHRDVTTPMIDTHVLEVAAAG